MTRARRSTEQVRADLLRAAAVEFSRRGYSSARTSAIAEQANSSESVLYRHFRTKADLFAAAVAEPFGQFLAEFSADFRNQLREGYSDRRLIEMYVEALYAKFSGQKENLLAVVSAAGDPAAQSAIRMVVGQMNEMFEELFALSGERWRAGGGFPIERMNLWHRWMVGMVLSTVTFEPLIVPDTWHKLASDQIVESMTDLLMHGLLRGDSEGTI